MTPSQNKTPIELAEEYNRRARTAFDRGDFVFALELAQHAYLLLRQASQGESKNDQLPKN